MTEIAPPEEAIPAAAASLGGRALRWAGAVAVAATIVWSARAFLDYGGLLAKLAGKPLIERGRIGANEVGCFLSRAGRVRLRHDLAPLRALTGEALSEQAEGWVFVRETENALPADAKIYLNVPDLQLYFHGTCVWYPRRVDVSPRPGLIMDGDTLLSGTVQKAPSEWPSLRALGYTHLVQRMGETIRLIDLRERDGEAGR